MSIAKIVAALIERGEEDLANELIAQGPHGKRQGPRDGSGPNPNCPLKSDDEEDDEELEDESQAASPTGKPQQLIMDYLDRPGSGSVDLTDMSSHPSFRGIHFAKIQKAAEVLDKKGMVKFDGAKLSKADADIDAELDEAAEAMGPHLFAVDCVQWPSSKKADYKPWKEAVKEWAATDPKKCEVIDQEGESVDTGATFRAARKFGVMRADADDAEIDAELEALADSDLSPEPSAESEKVLSKIHHKTVAWADEMDKMAGELKKAAAKEKMAGAKKRMEKLAKDMASGHRWPSARPSTMHAKSMTAATRMEWPRELGKAPTKKPQVVELPDGAWAIAVETDWPSRAKFFWAGVGGHPWCRNMGKAMTFEAFTDANTELSRMTTTKAQAIAKLVEAGHEDLADSLYNLVTGKSMHIAVRELPAELQKALSKVGFRKSDIEVIAADKYTMFGAGSKGRKDFTMAVNLKTGKTQYEEGSWGGQNMFVKNPVDSDDKPRRLPPDFAVIKGSSGHGPTWARILVHPTNLANLLPATKDDGMPKEELAALAIISGIKGGKYRRDEFSRYKGLGEYGPNNGHIKSLLNKGMVKISKSGGISITTKGKNVNPGYQKLYSIMKG